MENAVIVIPMGSFTPRVSKRVCDAAIANSIDCPVVIAMQNADDYSSSALGMLASSLRAAQTPHPIRVTCTLPRARSLMRIAGIENVSDSRDRVRAANHHRLAWLLRASSPAAPATGRKGESGREGLDARVRLLGRIFRIITIAIMTLLGSLSAISLVNYAAYGRVFAKTVRAAASYMAAFYAVAYIIWRACGGKRQFDLDRERTHRT